MWFSRMACDPDQQALFGFPGHDRRAAITSAYCKLAARKIETGFFEFSGVTTKTSLLENRNGAGLFRQTERCGPSQESDKPPHNTSNAIYFCIDLQRGRPGIVHAHVRILRNQRAVSTGRMTLEAVCAVW